MRGKTVLLATGFLALGGAVGAVQAQGNELEDGRWLPYLGCWVDTAAPAGSMTCIVPEESGVALLTVVGTEVEDRRLLDAGSTATEAEVAGCTGTESAEFSSDGHRLFTRSELTCDGFTREVRGLIAMVGPMEWIEVRALAGEAGSATWVRRYRPAPADRVAGAALTGLPELPRPGILEAARLAAASPVSVDDLVEAHGATDPETVKSWLVEQGDPLPRLDADGLIRLADAGVEPDVIDVAVAVSFPDRFDVTRESRADRRSVGAGYGYGSWGAWSPFGPYLYDPFYYRHNRYYGYGYGYGGVNWFSYTPSVVVVEPRSSSGGRVVKGGGYRSGSGTGTTAAPSAKVRPGAVSGSRAGSGGYRGSSSGSSSSGSKGKAKPKPRGGGG